MKLLAGAGLLLTAGTLGVTHGLEPDHAAGILSLTNESGDRRLGALVGACFALGHVVLVGVWIGVAGLLFDTGAIPQFVDEFGTVVLGLALLVLGTGMGVLAGRKFVHRHDHSHGDEGPHRHYHAHLPLPFFDDRSGDLHPAGSPTRHHDHDRSDHDHSHDRSVGRYLKIGVVGALFTLSPPLSMLAFVSIVITNVSASIVAVVVGIYAVAIVLTMALIGSGIGVVFARVRDRGPALHASMQFLAAVLVVLYGCYFLQQAIL